MRLPLFGTGRFRVVLRGGPKCLDLADVALLSPLFFCDRGLRYDIHPPKRKDPAMAISRSENMRRIRSKDTAPELKVRKLLVELGYRGYRLHRKDLPGKPDVAFIGKKKAILIHGCFWHGHDCKVGQRKPKSNITYWLPKIERNRQRDASHMTDFSSIGWKVLVVWECELQNPDGLAAKIQKFMLEPAKRISRVFP